MMRLRRVCAFVNLTAQFEKYFNKRENVEKAFDLDIFREFYRLVWNQAGGSPQEFFLVTFACGGSDTGFLIDCSRHHFNKNDVIDVMCLLMV